MLEKVDEHSSSFFCFWPKKLPFKKNKCRLATQI
jgi:hypothetical protein